MGDESIGPDLQPAGGGAGQHGVRALMPGSATFRSWLILAASLGIALAIYYGFLGSSLVDYVAEWTAVSTSAGLNLLGTSTRVDGTILSSGTFVVDIVAECTAVGPLVLFIGAVAAYPSPLRAKSLGVLLGLVVLSAVNLVRIISLFLIGSAYPEYLEVAHLLVWQTAIILFAIILWLFWVERLAGARDR